MVVRETKLQLEKTSSNVLLHSGVIIVKIMCIIKELEERILNIFSTKELKVSAVLEMVIALNISFHNAYMLQNIVLYTINMYNYYVLIKNEINLIKITLNALFFNLFQILHL
jgi:hypothetical protein